MMNKARRKKLASRVVELTEEEIKQGYHFCPISSQIVGPEDEEWEDCFCSGEDIDIHKTTQRLAATKLRLLDTPFLVEDLVVISSKNDSMTALKYEEIANIHECDGKVTIITKHGFDNNVVGQVVTDDNFYDILAVMNKTASQTN